MTTFQHVLAATDFGESSARAVESGIAIARQCGANLTLVHVCELPAPAYEAFAYPSAEAFEALIDASRKQLDEALAAAKQLLPDAKALLRHGAPWQQILNAAEHENADLVVVGTHGRSGLSRVLLGSVAERVVRLSPVPVLVVP